MSIEHELGFGVRLVSVDDLVDGDGAKSRRSGALFELESEQGGSK
jgi:hypothetical protein